MESMKRSAKQVRCALLSRAITLSFFVLLINDMLVFHAIKIQNWNVKNQVVLTLSYNKTHLIAVVFQFEFSFKSQKKLIL